MKKTNYRTMMAAAMASALCITSFTGCSQNAVQETTKAAVTEAAETTTDVYEDGGVLYLRVNPEIAVLYDEDGFVTDVKAENKDAEVVIEDYAGFEGKECKVVVAELVNEIGEAGYFVEEIDGEKRQITIEIEKGSRLPDAEFLDEVVREVRACVTERKWHSPLVVEGESDFGITDYVDTDYGPEADGVTDYDDTDYGPNNDGVTDYDDTDYGPNADGVTDYGNTDYGPNHDGVTDFGVTDYVDTDVVAPVRGSTDYDDTDYGPNNDGVTDYDDTDYGPNNDGVTDYDDTDYGPNNDGVTDYNEPATDYGQSDYDSDGSDYDGGSDYDD